MLTLRLLGPIDIRLGTQAAVGASDKGLLLLAYLAATAGRRHAREDLADLFWPAMTRKRGLHNLRQTMLRLRGLLLEASRVPRRLIIDARSVQFNRSADYWLDLESFVGPCEDAATEALAQRAALYRGAFMEDIACDIGERFADWVDERRNECRVMALALEETLIERYERVGQLGNAVEHASRCVALEPWREAGQRRLMRLLALSGQADAALRQFDALRVELGRELGADVEAETLALVNQIRSGRFRPTPAPPTPTERRHVVVLDCGLARGVCDDPEVLETLLAEPCRLARNVLETHGGRIAGYRPGRVSAFFGWPAANEHAAEHAVQAAQQLLREMAGAHPDVDVAIGVHGGLMLDREGDEGGWHVVEQAMRVRLAASAATIVVSEPLAARLREHFDLHPQPEMPDVGRAIWRLGAERRRTDPAGDGELHPLFGRREELARLTQVLHDARANGLRVIAITGQAGIGKSRLARELSRIAGRGAGAALWCDCEPRGADNPLLPVVRALRHALHLQGTADAAAVHERLAAVLGSADDGARDLAGRLAPLFRSNETPPAAAGASAAANASAAADRRGGHASGVIDALSRLAVQLAEPAGTMVVEDIHWADSATLELLDVLVRRHAQRRILVVLTARRLPQLPAALMQRVDALELPPLGETAAAGLAGAVASRSDGAQTATLVRAAEGIPLFIVELARMRSAAGDRSAASDRSAACGGSASIPPSLHDLLASRLDQAGEDKALLQSVAVIGREFRIAHLLGLLDGAGLLLAPLKQSIDRLVERRLLEYHGAAEDTVRFSHALLQRAAYESLPQARRAELHRRYAALLQREEVDANVPGAIARHLSEGGLPGEAARWWLRAAQRASQMEAYAETAQLAEQALGALAAAKDRLAQTDVELHALLLAAYAHVALGGYFNPAAQALYERARELVQRREADPREMLGVLRGHWLGASSRACYREARALAGEMISVADRAGLVAFRGIGRYLAGNAALWLAQFQDAVSLLEEALALLGVQTGVDALIAHDQDFEATATSYLGWGCWYLGHADRALELGERAIELARRRGHVLTVLHTMMTYCSIAMGSVVIEKVSEKAEEMIHLAQSRELAMWADMGRLLKHWARAHRGLVTDAAAAAQTLDRLCTMYPGGAAGFQVIFADACLVSGERARARDTLAALEISLQATEARIFAATRHILAGELAQRERHVAEAAAQFRRAIEIAAEQGSPMLEARARAALRDMRPTVAAAPHARTLMLGAAEAPPPQRKLAH